MVTKKLQSLQDELFNSDEILSNDKKELIEVIGGALPDTSRSDDCSDQNMDLTSMSNDTTSWNTDSGYSGVDTFRNDDGCDQQVQQAAQVILDAIDNYNQVSNGVVSGDLMAYECP